MASSSSSSQEDIILAYAYSEHGSKYAEDSRFVFFCTDCFIFFRNTTSTEKNCSNSQKYRKISYPVCSKCSFSSAPYPNPVKVGEQPQQWAWSNQRTETTNKATMSILMLLQFGQTVERIGRVAASPFITILLAFPIEVYICFVPLSVLMFNFPTSCTKGGSNCTGDAKKTCHHLCARNCQHNTSPRFQEISFPTYFKNCNKLFFWISHLLYDVVCGYVPHCELKELWHVVQEGEDNHGDHERLGGVNVPARKTYKGTSRYVYRKKGRPTISHGRKKPVFCLLVFFVHGGKSGGFGGGGKKQQQPLILRRPISSIWYIMASWVRFQRRRNQGCWGLKSRPEGGGGEVWKEFCEASKQIADHSKGHKARVHYGILYNCRKGR